MKLSLVSHGFNQYEAHDMLNYKLTKRVVTGENEGQEFVWLEKIQAELAEKTISVSSGGGIVEITITGDQKIQTITINPEVIDPDEVDMLEDLLVVAVNDAVEASQKVASEKLGALTGGLNIPGIT